MCPSTRDAPQGLVQDCFSSEDPILSEDPSARAADAKAARNVDNLGCRRRGGRKDISAHTQTALKEQWRFAKSLQPSTMATQAELEAYLKPSIYAESNVVVVSLVLMLLYTRSGKIAQAIQEIVRLGLAGPDWRTRGSKIRNHIAWMDLEKKVMAVELLATRASGAEIANRIAARYGGSSSFEAASKAEYRMLRGLGSPIIDFLLKLPVAERRRGLKIARAKLGFGDNEELSTEQSCAVLETIIFAYVNAGKSL